MQPPRRTSVDLTDYPELVVVYLGFRVRALRGLIETLDSLSAGKIKRFVIRTRRLDYRGWNQ